eukprot:Transcript_25098.p1 GENE.Transcript_25098~~Transcript_25098.p1  ORF type:complete len:589 (-),score=57.33 Transcript_25098:1461-3170(-)
MNERRPRPAAHAMRVTRDVALYGQSLRPGSLSHAAAASARGVQEEVLVGDVKPGSLSGPIQTCVSVDWWPPTKTCSNGDCPWANSTLLTLDLHDPLLTAAVRALSPLILRAGGSLADQVTYTGMPGGMPDGYCKPFARDASQTLGYRGGCLPFQRYAELLRFCAPPSCQLLWHANALHGRVRPGCAAGVRCRNGDRLVREPCCSASRGAWDASNLLALLRHARDMGLPRPWGVGFGNEIAGAHGLAARLPAAQYAAEVTALKAALVELYGANAAPRTLAPDGPLSDREWLATFLRALRPAAAARRAPAPLDVLTYHAYPLGRGDPHASVAEARGAPQRALSREIGALAQARSMHAALACRNATAGCRPALALTETGGAYNSGARGLTDRYISGFWWNSVQGLAAEASHEFSCRQSLVGGRYALLDLRSGQPLPDFCIPTTLPNPRPATPLSHPRHPTPVRATLGQTRRCSGIASARAAPCTSTAPRPPARSASLRAAHAPPAPPPRRRARPRRARRGGRAACCSSRSTRSRAPRRSASSRAWAARRRGGSSGCCPRATRLRPSSLARSS